MKMKMKKLILLFTILCIGQLYCMESLESEWSLPKAEDISQLPKDVQQTIIKTTLAASNNLVEAINALKNVSAVYGVRYDLLNNTTVMHALTKKFPGKVKEEIVLAMEKPEMYQKLVTILDRHTNIRQAVVSIDENFTFDNLKDFTALMHMMSDKFRKSPENISKIFDTKLSKKYQDLSNNLLITSDLSTAKKLIQQGADTNFFGITYDKNGVPCYVSAPLSVAAHKRLIDLVILLLNAGANPYLLIFAHGKTLLDRTKDEAIKKLLEEAREKW